MIYRFVKPCTVKGYFEEPMYDEHPDVASYQREISHNYKTGDILIIEDVGVDSVLLADSSYGVSEHGSITRLWMNIKELESSGILYELSNDEIQKYWEIETAKEEYDSALYTLHHLQSYIHDEEELSEQIIEDYVKAIMNSIHARANLIIAQI